MKATFSVMRTTDPKKPGKSFELVDGKLRSSLEGRYMVAEASTREAATPAELRELWESLTANDCILQGVSMHPKVVVRFNAAAYPNGKMLDGSPVVARNDDAFTRPSSRGLLVIDTDQPATLAEVLRQLHEACPALQDVACAQASSTGARLFDAATGAQLKGDTGTHTIYLVHDASDVPRALVVLHKRLWLAGHGSIKLAQTGEMLVRSAADLAVRGSSHPLYIRAHLGQGLEQRKVFEVYSNSDTIDFLDTRAALPDLTDQEEAHLAELIQEQQREMQPQAEAQRRKYEQDRLARLVQQVKSAAEAMALIGSACRSGDLYGDWPIIVNRKQITVQDILDAPAQYHGKSCRDPLEPEYGSNTVATIFSNQAKPIINSHAHGGREYFLHAGQAPEAGETVDRLDALQDAPASSASEKRTHPLARFVNYDFKPRPPRFVIPDLIDNGLVTIAGAHGVGKTSAVLPLAMVAAGLHRPDEPLAPKVWRHVVYVCEDVAQAQRIITGLVRYGGLDTDEETVKERLHLVEALRLPPGVVAQVGAVYKAELTRQVGGVEVPPLVVLDTNAAVLDIEDTNANAKVSQAMYALKQGFSGLPVWVVCHVSKAVKNRKDLSELSALGGVAFEADSVQNLYLVNDGGQRYLVLGKCRFEKRWPELEIVSDYATEDVTDEHGQRVNLTLRWSFALPPERSRSESRQMQQDEERKQADIDLRAEILTLVENAARSGFPLNRAALRAKIKRRANDVTGCIEILLAEKWLDEVSIPPREREHPKKSSYLVKRTTQEHEDILRSQESGSKLIVEHAIAA